MLKLFKEHQPSMYRYLQTYEKAIGHRNEKSVLKKIFPQMRSISIDYGIMEKVSNSLVTAGDFGWSDVGSWSSLTDISKKDMFGNVCSGDVITINSANNIVDACDRTLTLLDVNDLVVVQTEKNIFITKKSSAQRVKDVVALLKKRKRNSLL
jgi:mannose-1-phosphate guanylyltransferase